jgi:phosphoribosylformimino-5-aminoimidazole carboxamide ribonucleotide (ProFAR) isomerase
VVCNKSKKYLDNLKSLQEQVINTIQFHNQAGALAIAQGNNKKAKRLFLRADAHIQVSGAITQTINNNALMQDSDSSLSSPPTSD